MKTVLKIFIAAVLLGLLVAAASAADPDNEGGAIPVPSSQVKAAPGALNTGLPLPKIDSASTSASWTFTKVICYRLRMSDSKVYKYTLSTTGYPTLYFNQNDIYYFSVYGQYIGTAGTYALLFFYEDWNAPTLNPAVAAYSGSTTNLKSVPHYAMSTGDYYTYYYLWGGGGVKALYTKVVVS